MLTTLWSLVVLAFVVLAAGGCGWRLLTVLGLLPASCPPSDRFLFSAGVGLGAVSLVLFGIGLAGLFRPGWIFGVLALAAIVCWRDAGAFANAGFAASKAPWRCAAALVTTKGTRLWGGFLLGALILAGLNVMTLLIAALAPPGQNDFDGLAYHLTVPALYLRWGAIRYDPFIYHSNWPQVVEMLYAISLAARAAAPPIHLVFGLLTAGVCWALARRPGAPAACAAMLAFWFTPVIGWEATVAYDDLAFTLFEALAVLAWARFAGTDAQGGDRRRWAALSGVCQGLALGVKYTALAFVPVLVVLFLYTLVARRPHGSSLRGGLLEAAVPWTVGAAVVAAPWYLRALIWTHNPVFPFYYSIFRGLNWSYQSELFYRHIQLEYGAGRSIGDFFLSPLRLITMPQRYYEPGGTSSFGTLFGSLGPTFLALPGMALLFGRPTRREAGGAYLLAAVFAAFYVEWYLLMQQVRYLLPALPLLAPLSGYAVASCWSLPREASRARGEVIDADPAPPDERPDRWQIDRRNTRPAGAAALLVLAAAFLWTSGWEAISIVVGSGSTSALRYDIGRMSSEEYLAGNIPELWQISWWLNQHVEKGDRVALIGEKRGFYIRADVLWLDGYEQTKIDYSKIRSPGELVSALKGEDIRYVVVRLGSPLGLAATYGRSPRGRPADWTDLDYRSRPSSWPPDRHWLSLYRDAVAAGLLDQVYPDRGQAATDAGGYAIYETPTPVKR
ncbi:MAG: phospholipid carrier-dependent glycosyltransferase [Chloroflexi bacterium]|nr:phospholipid carrier-dependent glycosyltransferase [Chloroflexota bacterium]